MKTPQSFSNKELNDYKYKVANGSRVNAFNSNLRCRGCKGEQVYPPYIINSSGSDKTLRQVHELQCEGPCGLIKVLDDFSKAQRGRGGKVSELRLCHDLS